MGVDFDDAVEISGDRPGKDAAYLLDSTRAREKLDWIDAIGLEEGIDETIEWVTNNLDTLRTMPLEYLHRP
jgi:dTDP-glucose 4,6-dehydratase